MGNFSHGATHGLMLLTIKTRPYDKSPSLAAPYPALHRLQPRPRQVAVAVALLDAGAHLDFASQPRHEWGGFTPLMHAAIGSRAGVVRWLLKRGADGTKHTTQAVAMTKRSHRCTL